MVAKVIQCNKILDKFKDLGRDDSFQPVSQPPKAKPSSYSTAVKTTANNWKVVASKKATHQGTKATQVNAFLLADHTVPPHILVGRHKVVLHLFYLTLSKATGAAPLLASNLLKGAQWSPLRNMLIVTFEHSISDGLRALTESAISGFFKASSEVKFADKC